jgi:hypothetical protein
MRVYHFVPAGYGLENIRRRRLKIATINELNDPFELLAINLANPELRRALAVVKQQLAATSGMLCFSRRWNNPVQWSHYADKHTGLCLGFDVPDKHLTRVVYSGRRLAVQAERLLHPRDMDQAMALKFLTSKFAHWRYEAEIRAFLSLDEPDPETGFYFADFSDLLALKEVIVGANAIVTRVEVADALGALVTDVRAIKARLAFQTFNVVRQRKSELWR